MAKKKSKPIIDDVEREAEEALEAAAEELADEPLYRAEVVTEPVEVKVQERPPLYDWDPEDLEPYMSTVNSAEDIRRLVNAEYSGLRAGKSINWRLFVILGLVGIAKEL